MMHRSGLIWVLLFALSACGGGGSGGAPSSPNDPAPPITLPPAPPALEPWEPNDIERQIMGVVERHAQILWTDMFERAPGCEMLSPDDRQWPNCWPWRGNIVPTYVYRDFAPIFDGSTARSIGQGILGKSTEDHIDWLPEALEYHGNLKANGCPDSSPYVFIGCINGAFISNTIRVVRLDDQSADALTAYAQSVDPEARDFTCYYTAQYFLGIYAHESNHANGLRHGELMRVFDRAVIAAAKLELIDELMVWDGKCRSASKSLFDEYLQERVDGEP